MQVSKRSGEASSKKKSLEMSPAYKKIISENDSKYFHRKKPGLQNCMIKQNSIE